MKVLHIGESTRGGVASCINELLDYQSSIPEITQLNLLLGSRSRGERFHLNPENIYYYSFDRKASKVLPAILQIRKYIRKLHPDIVHVHSSFAGVLSRAACLGCRPLPSIVYCAHGWSFNMEIPLLKKRLFAILERIMAWKTDLIINISQYEYETACAYNLPAEKMLIIYNGVRAAEPKADLLLPLDQNRINLLFVGRFDRQKGLDMLLRVLARQQFEHIKLFLLGERVLGDQDLCIPPGVVNLGWVEARDIDAYYQLFDAVIMPSRWEGFGLAAIEAMRNRKAVIASNRGSLPEIVSHGVNGYLFELDDEDQLLTLLGQLSKPALMDMGRKGYEIYRERFSSLQMNEQVLEQYYYFMDRGKGLGL